ncbi:MAG TPA: Mur ligase family protein [Longimicrobiales bacterium]
MTPLTYADLVRELFPRLTGGIRWGLERTNRLLASVQHPQRGFRSLHVGGTNGKGSVCASLDAVLRADGRRVGLYTSPHLCSFRERIRLDGEPLGEEALLQAARRLWPALEAERPSFFEATTALAFLALADAGADVVVAEVGLGGRLDSTNVLLPEVTVLTNVAMDHAQYLGSTLQAIAGEKAGIIKAGVPVVSAEREPLIRAIFRERAAEVGAPFHALAQDEPRSVRATLDLTRFELETASWGLLRLATPLPGAHQAVNAALAVRALELLPADLRPARAAVVEGLVSVRWPGRLQHEVIEGPLGGHWLFDVAHNPAGVEALLAALPALELPRPLVALVGILGDKDWRRMLPPLAAAADALVLTEPPTAPAERRWDAAAVLARLPDVPAEVTPDFGRALRRSRALAGAGTVLVTGSFHTVGDALAALGRAPAGVDPPLHAESHAL